jgi:hypothetical protein
MQTIPNFKVRKETKTKSQKDLRTVSMTNTGCFRANMLFGKFTATPTVGRSLQLREWAQND